MKTKASSRWLMKASPCVREVNYGEHVSSHTSSGPCELGFSTPLRIIYDHELVMYRDCVCRLEFEDGETLCGPDSFIIVRPGEWHSELCVESRGGSRSWCHFDWEAQEARPKAPIMSFASKAPGYGLCRKAPGFVPLELLKGSVRKPSRCYELAARMEALMKTGGSHERMLAGAVLHELLIELLDAEGEPQEGSGGVETELPLASRMRRALDLAALHGRGEDGMKELLSEFRFSYEHLCRTFKKAYGVSPLGYLHAQQVAKAKALLRGGELSVSEICERVGMNSPSYFAKTFKAHAGTTPSEYRAKA